MAREVNASRAFLFTLFFVNTKGYYMTKWIIDIILISLVALFGIVWLIINESDYRKTKKQKNKK